MANFKVTGETVREGSSRYQLLKNKETKDSATAIYIEIPGVSDRICIDFKKRTRFDVNILSDEKTLEYEAGTHTLKIVDKAKV